jgi:hypothetical protein
VDAAAILDSDRDESDDDDEERCDGANGHPIDFTPEVEVSAEGEAEKASNCENSAKPDTLIACCHAPSVVLSNPKGRYRRHFPGINRSAKLGSHPTGPLAS